jgi:Tetratricopeptide repeat
LPKASDRRFRLTRIIAISVAVALLASALLVIPGWVPLLPRSARRGLTEGMLRVVLVGYGGLVVSSLVATPVLGFLLLRSRRARTRRPIVAKGFLIAVSCLFSLIVLELGSTVWRSWMHRFPKLPVSFPAEEPGLFRIVVLGGSSALGEPYRPWISPGQIVAWRLAEAIPSRQFECEIIAWLGDSLEMQHRKLAALTRRPEMVIIYSGHNEFAARYEEERDGWLDPEPGDGLLQPIYRASLISPFCRLAYEIISKNRLDEPPPLSGRHQLIDPPQCSPAEAEAIRIDFEGRLEALTAYCEAIGAVPVLIIPPANEADYEPSRSTLPKDVPQPERAALEQEFALARELAARDPAGSAERLQNILDRYPGFAEAHYRLAWLLERAGRLPDAERHYQAALDHDGLPIRCPAALRAAYDRVAARHSGSILIDGRRELAAASPRKLLDDHVIQDTHHPTLIGQVALADAVLRELARKKVFGSNLPTQGPLDSARCAAHFEMDAARWASMCERTSEHYRRVAGYRYDPAERLEKSRKYAQAAKKIRNGASPEQVGVPGVGALKPGGPGPRGGTLERSNARARGK